MDFVPESAAQFFELLFIIQHSSSKEHPAANHDVHTILKMVNTFCIANDHRQIKLKQSNDSFSTFRFALSTLMAAPRDCAQPRKARFARHAVT